MSRPARRKDRRGTAAPERSSSTSATSGFARGRNPSHLVAGERAVTELVQAAPGRVERIWLDRRREPSTLASLARARGIEVELCDAQQLSALAGDLMCRGVLASARPPPLHDLKTLLERLEHASTQARTRPAVLVALDGVQDPQNLGAIVRSCDFFGVLGVFWPRDRAAGMGPAAVRASAGATERIPMGEVTNLARALAECREAGAWILGTVPEGGTPLPELVLGDRLPEPLVVVMGGEHEGMRRLTRETCDLLATIPSAAGVASLNVSAATAVTLSWVMMRAGR